MMLQVKKMPLWVLGMIFLCLSYQNSYSQVTFDTTGIHTAIEKARLSGKIVFVEVTTESMRKRGLEVEEKVFTIDSIADFLNENCVLLRVDMRGEYGPEMVPHLAMLMYPTYIFFDADTTQLGNISHAEILKNPGTLLKKAQAAQAEAQVRLRNNRSIQFADGTWKELLARAKKENKLIFLDAYTSWCRPCMMMAKNVFTLNDVADFYNDHFINVSMNMEKGVGPELVKKYKIKGYPDFLFIDGNGKVYYRNSGYMEAPAFITEGQKALDAKSKK